jgi:hypothetical protein
VALGGQVVDLVGLNLLEDADQVGGIGQVPVVEDEITVLLVGVLVQVVDAVCVEKGGPALDAVRVMGSGLYYCAFSRGSGCFKN